MAARPLVIVESPAKAKTLGRFLGANYRVEASYGHIRDLPESAADVPKEIKAKDWAGAIADLAVITNKTANDPSFGAVYDVRADRRSWAAFVDFLKECFA